MLLYTFVRMGETAGRVGLAKPRRLRPNRHWPAADVFPRRVSILARRSWGVLGAQSNGIAATFIFIYRYQDWTAFPSTVCLVKPSVASSELV